MDYIDRLYHNLLIELETTGLMAQDREEALLSFARTPYYVEKVLFLGTFICLDSFLYVLTILPLRFGIALYIFATQGKVTVTRRGDLIKGLISGFTLWLMLGLNTSKIYHGIRGQNGIKLFVLYNVLEIADKFCCSIGQDILECLVSLPTALNQLRTIVFSIITLVYCVIHSFVLMWEMVTLNVAVNSYSNALLTLMLSNQFGEIKSTVFKKFDRESLFQATCEDIAQRFQLSLILLVVSTRNVLETWAVSSYISVNRVQELLGPSLMVIVSMVIVDWLKHAYIARFNNFRPKPIYTRFFSIFIADYIEHRQLSSAHLMMKRTGLPVLPLAIVCARMLCKLELIDFPKGIALWSFLLVMKLVIGVGLENYMARAVLTRPQKRQKEDLDTVTRYSFPNKAWL